MKVQAKTETEKRGKERPLPKCSKRISVPSLDIPFDLSRLALTCLLGQDALMSRNGYNRPHDGRYAYHRRGAPVLAVAHCDFIGRGDHFETVRLPGEQLVFCEALDDRLGVYIITELLPAMDIKVDVLLTTDEECAASSARDWVEDWGESARDDYNWVVSFDRRGEGAVLYQFEKEEIWKLAVEEFFDVQMGTYSDISCLSRLRRCGLNVGTGYHAEHTSRCYFSTAELFEQLSIFKAFYDCYHDVEFEFTPPRFERIRTKFSSYWPGHWHDDDVADYSAMGRASYPSTWKAYQGECFDADWIDDEEEIDLTDPLPKDDFDEGEEPSPISGDFYCLTCGEPITVLEYISQADSWIPICPLCGSDHVINEADLNR